MSNTDIVIDPVGARDVSLLHLDVGVKPVQYLSLGPGSPKQIDGEVVDEALVCISVNGEEVVTFMCSPNDLKEMAVGFLYNEEIIDSIDDVRSIHISKQNSCVDVWLKQENKRLPERKIITAGCGGGITFDDLSAHHDPLISDMTATSAELAALMRQMHMGAKLYHRARGIHTAALGEELALTIQVEDVGRHNCLDKLAGVALLSDIQTHNRVLLSSGRISSEMINKARRLKTPIVCSRTSPTSLSVALAEMWNLTIVAYLRKDRMRVYTHRERLTDLRG
jgi:FdhD protein